jgi:glutathione S-transferase
MKLYHCVDARSLRPLWALEEMGLPYELEVLPFPPRVFKKDYLGVNPLGTIPYLVDGDTHMTESSGICHYLVERYGKHEFGLQADHPEFGSYINWLFHSDATLTFPQTVALRYGLRGPNLAPGTACASGAHAIGDAARAIAWGDADAMVAGGSEAALGSLALAGFGRARALGSSPTAGPFSAAREGFAVIPHP